MKKKKKKKNIFLVCLFRWNSMNFLLQMWRHSFSVEILTFQLQLKTVDLIQYTHHTTSHDIHEHFLFID